MTNTELEAELIELRKRVFVMELFVSLQVKKWPWDKAVFEPKVFPH